MKKNVKGFIALFAGIGAFVLTAMAMFIPLAHISGSSVSVWGTPNMIMAFCAAALGITAIVFGILSCKNADAKGPRKAGIIVGVFAMLIALAASGISALTGSFADYANGKPNTLFSQLDSTQRKSIDDSIAKIRAQYPAKK